jgi:hypothetical protein
LHLGVNVLGKAASPEDVSNSNSNSGVDCRIARIGVSRRHAQIDLKDVENQVRAQCEPLNS